MRVERGCAQTVGLILKLDSRMVGGSGGATLFLAVLVTKAWTAMSSEICFQCLELSKPVMFGVCGGTELGERGWVAVAGKEVWLND